MDLDRSRIHNILIIKLRAIGDVLLSTVVINNLRSAFADAQIDFLTEHPCREVLEGYPGLDASLIFNGKEESGWSLIQMVRRRRYDLVIDLFGNPRSAIVTLLSGARYKVGYRFSWRKYCYNVVIEPRGGEVHNTEFNLDALHAIGVPVEHTTVSFPVSPESEHYAEEFIRNYSPGAIVALNPGGGWYTKRWKNHQFAGLADRLVQDFHARIIVLWGPGEENDAKEIVRLMNHPASLIPATTLKQLASIIKRVSAVVTNDSGPMHIAAAVGTPVVAIFGPTNPRLQGPVGDRHVVIQNTGIDCLGCNYTTCPIGNICMEELSVETVLTGFVDLVKKNALPLVQEPVV